MPGITSPSLTSTAPDAVERWNNFVAAIDWSKRAENPFVLQELDLRGRDLTGVNLSRMILDRVRLAGATLTGADMHQTVLRFVDLTDVRADGNPFQWVYEARDLRGVHTLSYEQRQILTRKMRDSELARSTR